MARTVSIRLTTRTFGERVVRIMPHWAGQGIAIHKPLRIDPENGEATFDPVRGYWRLTHIPTALALGSCMGNLERAKGFARAWDAEFAALQPGQTMAPDRLEAWRKVVEEMKAEPLRAPRAPRERRRAVIAVIEAEA
jgi:hypothetical protein